MVNATPVVATRVVDIPEYLGDFGIYLDGSGESIAEPIMRVETRRVDVTAIGGRLRARAIAELDCLKIAEELSGMYAQILEEGATSQVQHRPAA
jgi:hypothetical protein